MEHRGFSRRGLLLAGGMITGAAALTGTAAATGRPGRFAESIVWASGENGRQTHFVYGLAVTRRDTVLAFSEARIDRGDDAPHDIVCRRSTDGGRTWSETIMIEPSDGMQSWTNPTPVVDRRTGSVFLCYALNHENVSTQLFLRRSDDDGRTWGDRIELTALFDGNPAEWTVHLSGPGHGLQLRDGRLVVQVWHRREVSLPVPERRYGVGVVISDDHGKTWRAGGALPLDVTYPINESRIVERPDGSLILNGRYASSGVHPRIRSVSRDGGDTWSAPVFDSAIRHYTAVDSGFAGYLPTREVSRTLFSRPDSTTARENLTVSLSYDSGDSFGVERVVNPGRSSYSDLGFLSDGTILVLYGRDVNEFNAVDHVVLARFDLTWLTRGEDSLATGPRRHGIRLQAELLPVLPTGDRPEPVPDPNAAGYALLSHAVGPAGGSLDLALDVPRPGTYRIAVRVKQHRTGATTRLLLDDVPQGDPFDTALTEGEGFAEFDCGEVRLGHGRHRLRFHTEAGTADSTLLLDAVRLTEG